MAITNDTRPIHKLELDQGRHEVGQYGVTRISAVDEHGEMSPVPWFEVWRGNALYCRVNGKYVVEVQYVEGQSDEF